jgi:hypothetical protein
MKTLYTYTEFINESLLVEGDLLKMEVTDEVAKKIDNQFRKMVKDKIAKSGNTKNKELPQFLDFEKNPNSYYLKAIEINKSQNTLLLTYAGGVGNYYVIVFYDKKTGDLKGPDYLQENPSNWTKRQNAEYSWYHVDKKTGERKSSQVWFNAENKKI